MMRCAYHPVNRASVQCQACARPLCPMCDHRVRGFAYCQDCIVQGVEMLRFGGRSESTPRKTKHSPLLAAIAALIPGMGAVYNRQSARAFVHFVSICGVFELAGLTGSTLLSAGAMVLYLYSMVDAYRSAQAIGRGADPAERDRKLRRFLQEHTRAWAGILIALGMIFLVTDVFQFSGPSMLFSRLLPLVLAGLALYLLIRHWRTHRAEDAAEPFTGDFPEVTPALFSSGGGRVTNIVDRSGSAWSNYPELKKR
jgi:hypothetical protein